MIEGLVAPTPSPAVRLASSYKRKCIAYKLIVVTLIWWSNISDSSFGVMKFLSSRSSFRIVIILSQKIKILSVPKLTLIITQVLFFEGLFNNPILGSTKTGQEVVQCRATF